MAWTWRHIAGCLLLTAAAVPLPAAAACSIGKLLELPVTMNAGRPMVAARFGEKDARFILDSGAFYSTISAANASEFGLKVTPAPAFFRLRGVGGDVSAGIATTKDFALAGVKLPKADFIVGGSDTGTAGLLGQNILGIADVEYDLPHGAVRLIKATGCGRTLLAYWAGDRPVTTLALDRSDNGPFKSHTIGTVVVNGTKLRAAFDTGAQSSLLTLAAAKRLGVTAASPNVTSAGMTRGLGTRVVPAFFAAFDRIDIGGEVINRPKVRVADVTFGEVDMLIGIDFFLTHRIFVSNANHMMYLTYEGGPVFGLSPKGARTVEGKALDLTDREAAPTTAEGFSRRGAVLASNGRAADALAAFDRAIAMAPDSGHYLYQRAMVRIGENDLKTGLADLDRAITLMPQDAEARLTRAGIRLRDGDRSGARDDAKAADATLAPAADRRLALAGLYDALDMPERALANHDLWLKNHAADSRRPSALNGRCWARAQLGRDLDDALADCNAAIKAQPQNAAFLDSRGLVRLRRGELKQAEADYDAALKLDPRNSWTLYARSVVAAKSGKATQAVADRRAALAIDPKAGERAHRIGIEDKGAN